MSPHILRKFTPADLYGLQKLKNLIYPDHPTSINGMRHHKTARSKKINHKHWLFEKNKEIIGSILFTQWSDAYHPRKFVFKILIHPDYQGKGYGTLGYEHLINELKIFKPIKITAQVYEPHFKSYEFLHNRGFKKTIIEKESSLDLTTYEPALYQKKIDHILKNDFHILSFSKLQKKISNICHDIWEFEKEVAPDMPWADPITTPEYDVFEKKMFSHPKFNPDSWFFVLDNNRIAGMNNLWKSEKNGGIDTGLTGVRKEYRRRGIATALKHIGLAWAKDNGYDWIRTDNVSTNKGMLHININAGFKFMPSWIIFEKIMPNFQ